MLGLIAGTGGLPAHLMAQHPEAVVCEMEGFPVDLPEGAAAPIAFRLETLGTLIAELRARGVRRLCLAGVMARPQVDPARIDAATMPLVPAMMAALREGGDDAALRGALAIFEHAGFTIVASHELAPDLLPPPGVLAGAESAQIAQDAARGAALLAVMSQADLGQSCVVAAGRAIAVEAAPGTDWMLSSLRDGEAWGGVFYKAPKLGQDRRVDLPAIGPQTIAGAAQAGLAAVVVEAGGVLVLERAATVAAAERAKVALWVRQP